MDIEKLIEQLRTDSLYADKASLEIMDLCMDAANALSTLQAENEKLRAELEQVKRELDICIKAVFGDCDYCKYDRSLPDDTSPCWHCKEYAAQEFVTGNYWQWRGPEEG